MNPDLATGAGMAVLSASVLVGDWFTTRWTLTRRTTSEPTEHPESDDLAVARAAGVLVTAEGVSSGQMAAAIAWHANRADDQAVDTVVDHVHCEGQCGRILCCCKPLHTTPRCSGTTEQACGHMSAFCESCAMASCSECRYEQLPSTWFGGEPR